MRFWSSIGFVSGAALALSLAGCGEAGGPAGPDAQSVSQKVIPVSSSSMAADIMVTPSGGRFTLGEHAIDFPAFSICDPATSGYGMELWDAPCRPAMRPVHIHVEIREEEGWQWIEFTPELRFVPTTDPSRYVRLFMRTDAAQRPDAEDLLRILWAPYAGAEGIDESLNDPTQQTHIDATKKYAYRRIKHFSFFGLLEGYQASAGVTGR